LSMSKKRTVSIYHRLEKVRIYHRPGHVKQEKG
jgi:hypothetical protein